MKIERVWWKEAVGYQIYPRSFMDSNNDGIGDLNGIRMKLDYLKELGIDFIWINPVYDSPNVDNGYDISNYQEILGTFGTMADFDALLTEAHEKGIKIIMDLVINHTSDQHEWFLEARKSKDNPYRDYFIWSDGLPSAPPSEWESIFGGSAWEYDEVSGQYYLHVFAKEQPDLNWENEQVKNELFEMIRWWLDKGVDGFRLDAISHIKKAELSVKAVKHPAEPFMNVPGIEVYLKQLKELFREYDIMTVGEASGVTAAEAPNWTGSDGYFNMIFEFEHISLWNKGAAEVDIVQLKAALTRWQKALEGKGWNALYMENHDVPRSVSVYGNDAIAFWSNSAKALAAMFMLLQGTPFIYQGQEIGMTNYPFTSIDEIDAIDSKNIYQLMLAGGQTPAEAMAVVAQTTRDNSRTPMQWDDSLHAGFTEANPWMPINGNKAFLNVKAEQNDPDSVLNWYKQLIRLRKQNETLIYGKYKLHLRQHKQMYVYERVLGSERFLVMINLSVEIAEFKLPRTIAETDWQAVISSPKVGSAELVEAFAPYEVRIYRNQPSA